MTDTRRIVLSVPGPLAAGDADRLCAELTARAAGGEALVEIRLGGAVTAGLPAVEVLARLRLTARGLGCVTVVVGAGEELVALLRTLGLGFLLADGRPPGDRDGGPPGPLRRPPGGTGEGPGGPGGRGTLRSTTD
ncbi:hypothetical protein [Streptomyces fuscigenes]|uniref:hypothetical protein n=1 Tax=Streptomyces fuscigenes TaxID=1528880 RepID=UPI001F252318|nr:hypothetical protein [Streptomyces fuscigenes]MCF3962941.1 hypothetical protein [Streptomyces fuscigenes]